MPTLRLHTSPVLELSGCWIIDIGSVRVGGGGESPTMEVRLDPGHGELAAWLDPPPLRVRATLFFDSGSTFVGVVQSIRLGASPSLTLES
jgi:hypothetical protein